MRFLIDTNVLAEPVRVRPNANVVAALERYADQLATASLVIHELRFGCLRLPPSRKRATLERYLDEVIIASMPILPYDQASAEWHAEERARLSRLGRTPPFEDGQIAAIAATYGAVVVTANERDFKPFQGVEVVCWH